MEVMRPLLPAKCTGSVLVALRPTKLQALPSKSEVSDMAVNLLLNAVHHYSYPNMLKQVLFVFKDKLSYTMHLIID